MGCRTISILVIPFLVLLMIVPFTVTATEYVIGDQKTPVSMPADGATYKGAETCGMCHINKFNDWNTTGHRYKLNTLEEIRAVQPYLPIPDGLTENDILYVIGGWGWKARYIGQDGYIITMTGAGRDVQGMNQYNLATGGWVDYHPGEETKYDCTRCHNTGSSYESNQDDLPGMEGSWEFRGVQCEACHGPGSEHVAQGGGEGVAIIVDRNASMCGQCHRRGAVDEKIPASGNFVRHHEQYHDFLSAGKMSELDCVDCHDPHKPVHVGATNTEEGKGIIKQCVECHTDAEDMYEGTVMQQEGVTCIDCHMPRASKSAVAVSDYQADVRSHLFRMNLSGDAQFIYTDPADGKQYANPYLTLEYVCLPCHEDEDKAWAAEHAPEAMSLMEREEEMPTPEPTEPSSGFGIMLGAVVLTAVYLFRRR